MPPPPTRTLPVEVELALEVMPCQAMRRSYDGVGGPHPCAHFGEWGAFHSYDYRESGAPPAPGIVQNSVYAGKRPLVPEILSGCRKAPILAVGINPNLPGWTNGSRNAVHPYFEDTLQYAHHFRWRATEKLRIPMADFDTLLGDREDGPYETRGLTRRGDAIPVEPAPVTMYHGYQSLLDALAERMGWADHQLAVGEDVAYANMVACGSARWTTRPVAGDPPMPVMGEAGARGIVKECFHDRRYFLRQMLQTLPRIVIVFSQTTADAFVVAMRDHFTKGDPRPGEPIADLLKREIRLSFGRTEDGEELDARIVFSPHASARQDEFAQARDAIVDHLAAEVAAGRLTLNPTTGHLARPRGGCLFCDNALYRIGDCAYRGELQPLAGAGVGAMADERPGSTADLASERAEHQRLLAAFTRGPSAMTDETVIESFDDAAPDAPRLALRGKIVPMSGPPIERGTVYLHRGSIIDVRGEGAPPPDGFETVAAVDTGGVIYPGLADLHNHLAYNILSLWWPTPKSSNRSQWLRKPGYKRAVGLPMEVIAGRQDLIKALIRYVEVKLLLGGVTSGQGMKSKYKSSDKLYPGLVRNFEASDDKDLTSIGHAIIDLKDRPEDIVKFRASLSRGRKFFFHLSEGIDANAHGQFELLANNGLIQPALVGVHSLGLRAPDYAALAAAGAAVVWSPFSNSVLYGQTLDVAALTDSGARFALGSDWTPSGSRNILEEIKVASLTAAAQGTPLPDERLARAVTSDAMAIAGWGDRLGQIRAGYYADLTILDEVDPDPYANLLRANESHVRMVIIAGHPRYGDRALMAATGFDGPRTEPITVGGRDRLLNLEHPSSPLNHIGFAAARDALAAALADLPAARDATVFEPFDDGAALELDLDLQPPEPEWGEIGELADVTLPDSVPFDAATVIDDPAYWTTIDSIPHLPDFLKGPNGLRRFYA
jgi:cytosine/adenosine deaminase-related metal-dependent hydrolase